MKLQMFRSNVVNTLKPGSDVFCIDERAGDWTFSDLICFLCYDGQNSEQKAY